MYMIVKNNLKSRVYAHIAQIICIKLPKYSTVLKTHPRDNGAANDFVYYTINYYCVYLIAHSIYM